MRDGITTIHCVTYLMILWFLQSTDLLMRAERETVFHLTTQPQTFPFHHGIEKG